MDAMSSEDSCYEDDENGNPKVAKYAVRKLPWESRAVKKVKKKLDKPYRKRLSKRAKEELLPEQKQRNCQNVSLQMHFLSVPLRNRKLTAYSMFPTGPTQ